MRSLLIKRFTTSTLILMLYVASSTADIGQSAIISLIFPWGARSTGLGETFTGLADDAAAMYYNPAGLGQAPLATTWIHHTPTLLNENEKYTAVASKRKLNFGNKKSLWLGTNKGNLLRFNGKIWEDYDINLLNEGDQLEDVAQEWLNIDDDKMITQAIYKIKSANGIDVNKNAFIKKILSPIISDTNSLKKDSIITALSRSILALSDFQQNVATIFGIISDNVTEANADSASKELITVFSIEDKSFDNLIELRIPFSIAELNNIHEMKVDLSQRLWIATDNGLWRYDRTEWTRFTVKKGLPSNNITTIKVGINNRILIGTDNGLALYENSKWKIYSEKNGLPSSNILSVEFGKNSDLFAGTELGLVKIENEKITITDTSNGLISEKVTALMHSKNGELWVGGENGIAIYTGATWKRYKFPGSIVHSFAEYKSGRVWIGTSRGAIKYKAGRMKEDAEGNKVQNPPEWKPYHSKNALKADNVSDITIEGKDIWLVTDKTLSQRARGDMQFQFFGEPLLPAFNIPDLWHTNIGAVIPLEEWGTIGLFLNYLNFGKNNKTDDFGREFGEFTSYEYVVGLSYGINLRKDFSVGLNIKYARSALDPTVKSGIAQTFAVDAALLKRNLLIKNLDIGFMLQNMGPAAYYSTKAESDPIPFTVRLGIGYTPLQTPIHNLKIAVDLDKEIVYKSIGSAPAPFWTAIFKGLNDQKMKAELNEIIVHAGVEYWYLYFLALRMGVLYDEAGSRTELNFGIGLKYGKVGIDWSYIHSPKNSEARNQQWRLAFTVRP